MNTDIRLKVGFLDNPKVVKLQRRLGAEAVLSLIRLWIYTAENKPDGILSGLDAEDIEIACCWSHADSILTALLDVKLLEKSESGYIVHDWEDHNPWAANANNRSEQAREAANSRWSKKRKGKKKPKKPQLNADGMLCVYDEHADSNAPFLSFPFLTLPTQYSNSKEFAECWIDWEKYRKEKKQTLTETTVKRQINSLTKLSIDHTIATIDNSIRNGWTGLFPEKSKTKASPEKRTFLT